MGKKSKPIKLITLDTETYNGLIGELKRIAIYDGEKVHYGYTYSDIETILLNYANVYDVHVYIHNMEFDLRKIPMVFKEVDWKKSLVINGKLAKLTCENYIFHDSFKILPMSLKKLSKGFDVEHGKLDLWEEVQKRYPDQYKDLVDFLDRCDIENELYLEYLGYDVLSLYEVLQALMVISGVDLKNFVKIVSTSSLSRYIFKNGYKGKQFQALTKSQTDFELLSCYDWSKNLDVEEFLRMSYCGGRTEVFKILLDKTQGYHYDVNSLYPFVMKNYEYPIGKPFYYEDGTIAKHYYETWKRDKHGLGFINAMVFIPEQHIPPLPVKMGKLCFPCGTVYGTWTYEELEYAEKECCVEILEYYAVCHFEHTYKVFENFVDTFYGMKEQASIDNNEVLRTFCKLLLNVGYGYTGMRRDDKTSLDSFDKYNEYEKVLFADKELGFIEVPTDVKARYIQVQIASYVTSRARLVLLKGLRDIVNRGGTVYYCDTDSIVCDIPMDDSKVHDTHLGYWALESKPKYGLFLRPKVYTEVFENKSDTVKFKGITKETQSTLDHSYYEHLFEELKKGEKDYEIVEKNRLTLRSIMYMQKNNIDPSYYEIRDKKMNFKTVEKRIMNYEENYTKPYFFKSIEDFENFSFTKIEPEAQFNMKEGAENDE